MPTIQNRILLIEDNRDNRNLVCTYLEECYEVRAVADAFQALAQLAPGQDLPDLILSDISLPLMDGLALLQEIKSRPLLQAIPVVALTAHAMKGDKERFLNAGFDAYISKPIMSEAALFHPIEQLLTRRHGI